MPRKKAQCPCGANMSPLATNCRTCTDIAKRGPNHKEKRPPEPEVQLDLNDHYDNIPWDFRRRSYEDVIARMRITGIMSDKTANESLDRVSNLGGDNTL